VKPGKTAQREFGLRHLGIDVAEVNLGHFVAVALAAVANTEGDSDGVARLHILLMVNFASQGGGAS
jgi:hypothetical protein